jgi:pimeloyl-ACP methyl ester carboxylesterase
MANTESARTLSFDDVGQGPPVVLLHAFPLSRLMWRPQVDALRDSYRVITPDLRGFGGSLAFSGPPSVDQMADDVAALLDELKVQGPVALGGLSMGGYVALAFARRHAPRLRALVLADTRAEADDEAARANRDRLMAFAADNPAGAVAEQMLEKLLGSQTRQQHPEVIEQVRSLAAAQAPAGVVQALQAMRDRPDAGPSLADIRVPTLVLVGGDDVLTPPALAESLVARIPGARLEVIDGAGHLSNLERPLRFNAALRGFLDGLR